jgi:hypothetical protein
MTFRSVSDRTTFTPSVRQFIVSAIVNSITGLISYASV